MNRIAVWFALAFLLAPVAQAQPAPSACPAATTPEESTKALDDAASGPRDKERTCLHELLLPEARLTPIRKQADASFAPHILTVDDWNNAMRGQGGAPFYEKEVSVKSEMYGHFAHLRSTYEIRPSPDGKVEVIGINSGQAVYDGMRWRVLSILWESNATAGPVPEKYLP